MTNESAFEDLMKYSRICLSMSGAWPSNKNKKLSKMLFLINITIITICVLIPQSIKLITVRDNFDLLTQTLSTAELPYLVVLTKMIVLYYNKKNMTTLYNYMVDHWKKNRSNKELKIMMENGEKGKKFAIFCIFLGHAAVVSRLIQWTFENLNNWNNQNHYKNFTLYVEAYYPYTWNYSPIFELTVVVELVALYLGMIAYTSTDGYFCQIVFHLSGEYLVLGLELIDIVNTFNVEKVDYEFDKKFRRIVDVHDHIRSCIAILESTFYLMFLVQLIANSIEFCVQGFLLVLLLFLYFQYVNDKNPTSMLIDVLFIIVFLICMIGNFYVYCYLGEQLQMQVNNFSNNLPCIYIGETGANRTGSFMFAERAYDCLWYQLPPQKAKYLLLLMQSGHKPVAITAGKFCVLNFVLFHNIIKTSMALHVLTTYTRLSLAWFGVWPSHTNKTLSTVLFFISITIITLTVVIPQGIKLIQVRDNFDHMTHIISVAEIPYLIALTKMSVLFYKKEKMTILYNNIVNHWKETRSNEEIKIMMKKGDEGKKIALLCMFLGHAAMIARLIQCIFENLSNWSSSDHYKNYTLFVEGYYPFTWNYSPVFEITYIIQLFGLYLGMVAYSGTDAFFSQIVLHLSGEYLILSIKLTDIVNTFKITKVDYKFDKKFGHIVDLHDHINSCITILENTFYLMFLVQLIGCSIQFCMQGFLLVLYINGKNSTSMLIDVIFILVFLTYMIGNFYVYCYLGEQLQIQSFAFAQRAYDCVWYHLPPQKAKCLLLLMQSGHKPVPITAGKFCVLNLLLFRSIIKTSMGYLSFLITTRQSSK
ncbi:uncharacterized protein LOC127283814 [Leptopilina boulardi]|uniref:uncharacterized protein LOC127283814 n=1 Tax=Leptopilina boulardi TaxID=63433 RepID=UPI0021F5B248|nr:uncharacterized protein LOC127283814 [Leptopilina boulardi]